MTEAEALAALRRMADADAEPALSDADLADCLAMSRLADALGRAPGDPNWEPTWDLNRGAAEAWRRRAGRLAGRYDLTADGQTFRRSQAIEHCERMAAQYRRRIVAAPVLPGPATVGWRA